MAIRAMNDRPRRLANLAVEPEGPSSSRPFAIAMSSTSVAGRIRRIEYRPLRRRGGDELGGSPLGPDIAAELDRRGGEGRPLPRSIERSFGEAMRADLTEVRIHTGDAAAQLARRVHSQAFTHGRDIYFGDRTFDPHSPQGRHLLAHELAHTLQRDTAAGFSGPIIGRADDPKEAEADRAAVRTLANLRRQPLDGSAGPLVRPAGTASDGAKAFRNVRRTPEKFANTAAAKVGHDNRTWGYVGFGFTADFMTSSAMTTWDQVLISIKAYAGLNPEDASGRAHELARLRRLIATHRSGADADGDSLKVAALKELDALISAEHREIQPLLVAARFRHTDELADLVLGTRELRENDEGDHVRLLQQALVDTGYIDAGEVTGAFGPSTTSALKKLQARSLVVPNDGVATVATVQALQKLFSSHGAEREYVARLGGAIRKEPGEFEFGKAPSGLLAGTRNLHIETAVPKESGWEEWQSWTMNDNSQSEASVRAVDTSANKDSGQASKFVPYIPGRGTYEGRLEELLSELVVAEWAGLAKGKQDRRSDGDLFDWPHIERIAVKSKEATDKVFGMFRVGRPLKHGVGIHDAWDTRAKKIEESESSARGAARFRVQKLLAGDGAVRDLDREHKANQTNPEEMAIIERVVGRVVVRHFEQLLQTHKAWEAWADPGNVYIQRFKERADKENRDALWRIFQTVVHEYIHTLEHSRFVAFRDTKKEQEGARTYREGIVDYFTHIVLDGVDYSSSDLVDAVVGGYRSDLGFFDEHPPPTYHGYSERAEAEALAGRIGLGNVMAAFFLGHYEKVGGYVSHIS